MKLTLVLLTAGFLNVYAKGVSQNVTFSGEKVPLKSAFLSVKQQTGFVFLYTGPVLKTAKPITVSVKDMPLEDFLQEIFKSQPLKYSIKGQSILVSPKASSASGGTFNPLLDTTKNPIDVRGRVVDENGEPVAGATVMVKGTNKGTTTGSNGEFTLMNVDENAILEVSYVGYETKRMSVKGKNSFFDIVVKKSVNELDETVVIAYGKTTKRLATGNIASVKAADIQKQPINNPLLALQGRVPGVFVEQATGLPGSGISIHIQGQSSLNGTFPLYVIDGVPYPQNMLLGVSNIQGLSFGSSVGTGNPLAFINPADIESIEILKDADATAIYGSLAASGAVLITTKKGKARKLTLDATLQHGIGKVPKFVELLNTEQYLEMRFEAKQNDNEPLSDNDYDINGTWDKRRYTDWQKVLIGGTAKYTDAQLSMSTGNGPTSFLISSGYHRETTVFPGDLSDQKASIHFNLNYKSLNNRFRFLFDAKYLADKSHLLGTDLTADAINLAPNAPALYTEDQALNWELNSTGFSTWANPLRALEQRTEINVHNLLSNMALEYELCPGLELKSTFGVNRLSKEEVLLRPLTYWSPEFRAFMSRQSEFDNQLFATYTIEPQITYKTMCGNGTLEVLTGGSYLHRVIDQTKIFALGFTNDQQMKDIGAAADIFPNGTTYSDYRYNALFGRLNYNFQNKLILNLTARRDGSSRFGSETQLNNFYSIAGAWIFSDEMPFKGKLPFVSFGKIRFSYGTTGNDQIGDYKFLNLYFSRPRTVPYQGVTGLVPSGYPNPFLQWEETHKMQGGIDLGFLSNKFFLNINYFRNRSSNQLQGYALPPYTGATDILINFPALIENSGFEIALQSVNLKNKDFVWETSVNLTIARNKLVKYDGLNNSSQANTYIVGQPFTIARLYHSLGVDPSSGLYIFSKVDGSISSNPAFPEDRMIIKNVQPTCFGGLQNSIKYRGFSLDFLFQFVKQVANNYNLGDRPGLFFSNNFGTLGNQPISVMNRWRKLGDVAVIQRFSAVYASHVETPLTRASQSDLNSIDASYIRLKNLSLSYEVPLQWRKKLRLSNVRLFVQGQNLWTITDYVVDPESKSIMTLPPLRVCTLGLNVSI